MLESTSQDLSYGLRMLRRSPGSSLLAVLCLAIGIGANAAVFSWIEGILLRPYPMVTHQERLFALAGTNRGQAGLEGLSWPDLQDLKGSVPLVDTFVVTKITGTTLSVGDRAERATGSIVSANYFDALGVTPLLGRGFRPEEETGRNAHPVTVISHQMWMERFGGDPSIVGKMQRLNGVPHEIIGVAPPEFKGTFVGWAIQFWVPASMEETFEGGGYKLEDRGARWIESYALLRPGATRPQAEAQITAAMRALETAFPQTNRGHGVHLFPLWQTPFNKAREMRPALGVTLGVVVLVLLIACANVANLLFVRALARRRELTVRLALGCGRARLVRQLLVEGLLLSLFATVLGLGAAFVCRNLLVEFFPAARRVAMSLRGTLDARVVLASALVCVLVTVLAALAPALRTTRLDLAAALNAEAGSVVGGSGRTRARSVLVLAQVALGFVLLAGTGLLLESLHAMSSVSPGFSTEVLTTAVDLMSAGYDDARARAFEDELLTRVKAIPGVRSAAYARTRPFTLVPYSEAPVATDAYRPAPDEQPIAEYNEVTEGYLSTMGIPLVSGREFTRADDEDGAPVAVVDETMAAHFWPGRDALGSELQVKGKRLRVVGIARASKLTTMLEEPKPFFYVPLRQNPAAWVSLFVETDFGPGTLVPALARELRALDAGLAPSEVLSMREQVDRMSSAPRTAATLFAVFGSLALFLASIGLYAVLSYSVSQGTREIGLRMALGSTTGGILRLVLSRGLALTAGGLALGAVAALASTRLVGSLLYGVGPRDPTAFGAAFAVMLLVSSAACFVPAWRATRTDPVLTLRQP